MKGWPAVIVAISGLLLPGFEGLRGAERSLESVVWKGFRVGQATYTIFDFPTKRMPPLRREVFVFPGLSCIERIDNPSRIV